MANATLSRRCAEVDSQSAAGVRWNETGGRALKTLKVLPPGYSRPVQELQGRAARYRPRDPSKLRLRRIFIENLDAAASAWNRFAEAVGP